MHQQSFILTNELGESGDDTRSSAVTEGPTAIAGCSRRGDRGSAAVAPTDVDGDSELTMATGDAG